MYLTRVPLNLEKRNTLKAMSAPSLFHGAIEKSFGGPRQRNLWRIDSVDGQYYLLILSRQKADFSSLVSQFGDERQNEPWKTVEYDKLLTRIKDEERWHFRLVANPTVSIQSENGRGKVTAHTTPYYQKQWLIQRAEKHGFIVCEDEFEITGSKWYRFYHGNQQGKPVSLLSVSFEGILTITNAELFCDTLINGIGKEKAYGQGLLTVIK